ncbi:MAG: hypothetical protein ACRDTF_02800 [Pseudonocardiaceae bacterium]
MAWRVARSLDVLLAQLNARFPGRSKASDGGIGDAAHAARASDHNPDSGGVVRARDYTHDPKAGVDIDRLSDELAASRDPRISYVIANNLIMSGAAGPRPWQWRAYQGPNPHRNHMHLSVVTDSRADDPRPWALPMLAPDPPEDDMPSAREIADTILDTPIQRAGTGQTGTTTLRAVIAWSDDATARHVEHIRTIVREELKAHLMPPAENNHDAEQ